MGSDTGRAEWIDFEVSRTFKVGKREGWTMNYDTAEKVGKWSAGVLDEAFGGAQSAIALSGQFPVSLIATGKDELRTVEDTLRISDILEDPSLQDFDFLPVTRKGRIQRLLRFRSLKRSRVIRDHDVLRQTGWSQAEPLSENNLMSVGDSLLSFILAADTCPCRLLLHNGQIAGIVTLSDLQRLPVRLVLFALVTHVELLMARLIRGTEHLEKFLRDALPAKSHAQIEIKWSRLRRSGLAIDRISATKFNQKVTILLKLSLPALQEQEARSELTEIEKLRHLISHAGDYALTRATAADTVKRARLAQRWIDILSHAVTRPEAVVAEPSV